MGRRILSLLALGILIPACKISPTFLPGPLVVVTAQLRGSQVVPAVGVPVTTTNATLTISQNRQSIDYSVTYTGSGTITAVEIRLGSAGSNGPLLFTLATGPFTNPLTGTLTAFDLNSVPAQDLFFFQQAVDRILNGETYILVSTAGNLTGEMRGQIGAATLASAVLSGAQVTPAAVAGTGTGTFTAAFDPTQSTITTTLTFSGVSSAVTAAHIHLGDAGAAPGAAVFDLSLVPFTSPLVVTLTAADVLVGTFADAVDAFLTGSLYVDLHAAPEEIRGQIGPARMTSTLDDSFVSPPVVNGFSGSADVILNAMQTEVLVMLTHDVLTPQSVRLRAEDPGFNGPQIFDVDAIAGSAASPVNALLLPAHLIPFPPQNLNTFPDVVNALLTRKTYLEVGSPSFPAGAIRGQIQ